MSRSVRKGLQFVIGIIVILLIGRSVLISLFRNRSTVLDAIVPYTEVVEAKGVIIREESVVATVATTLLNPDLLGTRVSANTSLFAQTEESKAFLEKALRTVEIRLSNLADHRKKATSHPLDAFVAANRSGEVSIPQVAPTFVSQPLWEEERISLEAERDRLKDSLRKEEFFSNSPGVLLNTIDGYEGLLTKEKVARFGTDGLILPEGVSETKEGLRIANNQQWYLLTQLPAADGATYRSGDRISLEIAETRIVGEVESIHDEGDVRTLVISSKEAFDVISDKRSVSVKIIKKEAESFVVPVSALVEKDDMLGVYVQKPSGVATFVPVIRLSADETSSDVYIDGGKHVSFKGADGEVVKSVQLYDEVLNNGALVEDGQLIQ